MDPHSAIDLDMIQAYEQTDYRVHGSAPLTLRIDTASPALATLHNSLGVDSSAFITACNPFSQLCDDASNAERQAALAADLTQLGLRFDDGIGQHPSNKWLGEPSFLVLGLTLEAAKELGVRHGQNAIVWCGPDAVPRLVLLR